MSGTFDARGDLDPDRPYFAVCLGRKGSGKSVMATLLFIGYPYDRVVIDVAGDDGPAGILPDGEEVIDLHGTVDTLPRRWPEHLRRDGRRMTLRYVPDAGSPTYVEDMDAIVALAYHTGRVALLVHEVHQLAPVNISPEKNKATQRLLQMGRHRRITFIACGPRPKKTDGLVLSQADLVYVFDVPNPTDRRRIAEEIGWPPRELDAGVHDLGPHEYLRHDANEPKPPTDDVPDLRLTHWDALPPEVVDLVHRHRPEH